MFRRPTWIALVIVVILVGVLFYTNREQKIVEQVAETFPTLPSHTVIPDEDGTATRIIFESATSGVVEVALNMQNEWEVFLPFQGAANQGNVEAAVTEIDTMRYVSELKDVAPADLGLDSPAYVLTLHFKNGAKHVIEIGDKTPSETGYYIRLDGKRLLVMENSAVESLLFLLETPPYQETPTPSPQPSTATSTGAPLPTETVTPAP
jgi:hypothetical protein